MKVRINDPRFQDLEYDAVYNPTISTLYSQDYYTVYVKSLDNTPVTLVTNKIIPLYKEYQNYLSSISS